MKLAPAVLEVGYTLAEDLGELSGAHFGSIPLPSACDFCDVPSQMS